MEKKKDNFVELGKKWVFQHTYTFNNMITYWKLYCFFIYLL